MSEGTLSEAPGESPSATSPADSGGYDSPSSYLDLVPRPQGSNEPPESSVHGEQHTTPAVDNSSSAATDSRGFEETYADIDEFIRSIPLLSKDESDYISDYEDEEGKEEGQGGKKVRRKIISQLKTAEPGDNRIYVDSKIFLSQPAFSFKTRQKSRHSREEIEEEGIYQGLIITDDQKTQLGILPEAIYMTVTLETWQNELDDISMELVPKQQSRFKWHRVS